MKSTSSSPTGCRDGTGLLAILGGTVLLAITLWSSDSHARDFRHHRSGARERVLRSPASPPSNSSSWIYRSFSVAAGTTWLQLGYDYLCSGGTGIACVSEYSTNGGSSWTIMQSLPSGHTSGHFVYALPTSYPTLLIRFRYTKATTVAYQDTMWVDDVVFSSNKDLVSETFEADGSLTGWTAGGTYDGFSVQKPPVARALGPTENMALNTTINLERSITFGGSTGNSCSITYATDTAPTHAFRVYEGTALLLEKSGESSGTERVPLSNGAGNKTLKLTMVKDGAPNGGRDLVRVRGITCHTASDVVVAHWDFDGQALGSSPYPAWFPSCSGSGCGIDGWRVVRATPHDSYVPAQVFGSEPFTLDGLPKEYKKQSTTVALQFDELTPANREASLDVFADGSSLYLYWRLNAVTPTTVGDETGYIYVYLDERRASTLARQGPGLCASAYQYPGDFDRFIHFPYILATGRAEVTVPAGDFVQQKGACNGGYVALNPGADLEVTISAHVLDPGEASLAVEMKIDLYGAMASEQLLGLGLRRYAFNPDGFRETLPFNDYGQSLPLSSDIYSWETIRLTSLLGALPAPTERFDGCCFAKRELL